MTFICVCGKRFKEFAALVACSKRHDGKTTLRQAQGKTTREAVLQDVAENGMDTLQVLGNRHGVTRQRTHQILNEAGISERVNQIKNKLRGFKWLTCSLCGQAFVRKTYPYAIALYKRHFCGACRKRNTEFLSFTCEVCDNLFARQRVDVENNAKRGMRPRWCSNYCGGVWLGRNHGRG